MGRMKLEIKKKMRIQGWGSQKSSGFSGTKKRRRQKLVRRHVGEGSALDGGEM